MEIMNQKTLIIIGLGILAVYLFTRNRSPQGQPYPMKPTGATPGTQEWILWVTTVIQAAGGLAQDLFGPGGPFYKENKQAIEQVATGQPILPTGQVIY
jgi:uncharacterized membrane protein YfcA